MDVLAHKYKQHREEILHVLSVSTDLLTLLTREGLLDIADCVKYQGIANSKRRAQALMKTLTERRTERGYTILLQCLRETGQHKAMDLLTDVGQEAQAIQQLQLKLDEQIQAIDEFLAAEEERLGIEPATNTHPRGHDKTPAKLTTPAVNDRQVWTDSQASMRREVDTLARCQTVICKLHGDCLHVANTNAQIMTETRNCYIQLCGMVRPSTKCADELQTATRTTQDLFRLLVADVNRLMVQRSKMAEREQEGRTSAMRTLRKLRDWIVDRCTVLSTLHSSAPSAPLGNSRFLQRRGRLHQQPDANAEGRYLATYKSLPDPLSTSEDFFSNDVNNGKKLEGAMCLDIIPHPQSPNEAAKSNLTNGSFLHDHKALMSLPPVASSTPQPTAHVIEASATHSTVLNIQPMSSVIEGVHQLEGQLREYIHLEILLTDRFRQELRRRQLQRKAVGFSSRGISDAQTALSRLTSLNRGGSGGEELSLLRSQLDQIAVEYAQCCEYMDKAAQCLVQIQDVENFLKRVQEREQAYRKNKTRLADTDTNTNKGKTSRKVSNALKKEHDAYNALVELFRGGKSKTKEKKENYDTKPPVTTNIYPRVKSNSYEIDRSPDNFLARLKILVANYEIVRLRMLTLEDRFRREVARRERETKSLLQGRDDEIYRLKTLLRESEAEREKYSRLYENTKISGTRLR